MSFAHHQGIAILLTALGVERACFPAEVYNCDEDTRPLEAQDEDLSEFARGIRFAKRKAKEEPPGRELQYSTWLRNFEQLQPLMDAGTLFIEPLLLKELPRRQQFIEDYGLGRGESACLVLAERYRQLPGIFLSSDEAASKVAAKISLLHLSLVDVLLGWARTTRPDVELMEELVAGMQAARFGLKADIIQRLRSLSSEL
ncbi:hypothetical protein [Gloeobacter kilaueensis]|uniref:Uncharacterized protein n=1 Tax=Gloeobacter kilaueensis (strain ATCC BAA-2537 / CCAP 1431/1 / ULC 316 / JS1) TaxID=1183438 RepID=U5QGW7_GLOK1|nr:hypothetical protein [Gloeobacter kilaueensis]AGY58222.1 hypothetical protein GKIL_1976 [Gloeobacter kilaueensis JS1]